MHLDETPLDITAVTFLQQVTFSHMDYE